jgi:hypothetical protein
MADLWFSECKPYTKFTENIYVTKGNEQVQKIIQENRNVAQEALVKKPRGYGYMG